MKTISAEEIIRQLRTRASERNRAGMARFGIETSKALGVSVTYLREIAKKQKLAGNHPLALALWKTNIHEARILATIIDDPAQVDEEQMEGWVREFDSWDLCDQCCMNLFDKTPFAWSKVEEWSGREEEYVKRASYALIASLASHDKSSADEDFYPLFILIENAACDERNFVKKAVNWALRGIGKRSKKLNLQAVACAERISKKNPDSATARWIAADAIRELTSEKIRARLG